MTTSRFEAQHNAGSVKYAMTDTPQTKTQKALGLFKNWRIATAVGVCLLGTIVGSTIAASVYGCDLKLGASGLSVKCKGPE